MKEKTLIKGVLGLMFVLMGIGLYVMFTVFFKGQGALFHSDDNLPWSLLIASYIFFVLTSTGVTLVASLPTLFGFKKYEPLVKRSIFIALVALIAGFISIGTELGNPFNMYNYILSPNFHSPIFWMGFFYSCLLVILSIKFYHLHKGIHNKVTQTLAVMAFVLEIAAMSTLGSVFGLIEARPTFFGEYIQVYFLFSAMLCGIAAIIFFNVLYYKMMGEKMPSGMKDIIYDLGKMLTFILGLTLLLSVWRATVSLYAAKPDYDGIQALINSWPYRIEIFFGLLLPMAMMWYKNIRYSRRALFVVSLMVLLGMGIGRMDLVMAGQLLPMMPRTAVSGAPMFYFPTIWEWFAGLFSLSFMFVAINFGERLLKLDTFKASES